MLRKSPTRVVGSWSIVTALGTACVLAATACGSTSSAASSSTTASTTAASTVAATKKPVTTTTPGSGFAAYRSCLQAHGDHAPGRWRLPRRIWRRGWRRGHLDDLDDARRWLAAEAFGCSAEGSCRLREAAAEGRFRIWRRWSRLQPEHPWVRKVPGVPDQARPQARGRRRHPQLSGRSRRGRRLSEPASGRRVRPGRSRRSRRGWGRKQLNLREIPGVSEAAWRPARCGGTVGVEARGGDRGLPERSSEGRRRRNDDDRVGSLPAASAPCFAVRIGERHAAPESERCPDEDRSDHQAARARAEDEVEHADREQCEAVSDQKKADHEQPSSRSGAESRPLPSHRRS